MEGQKKMSIQYMNHLMWHLKKYDIKVENNMSYEVNPRVLFL